MLQSTVLRVTGFNDTQPCCEYLTIGGIPYSGANSPDGISVAAGTVFSWTANDTSLAPECYLQYEQSDCDAISRCEWKVLYGFGICDAAPNTSASVITISASTPAPINTDLYFNVIASVPSTACMVTRGGACFTTAGGPSGWSYTNNERCTIRVQRSTTLRVLRFLTQSYHDILTVAGQNFSGYINESPEGVAVSAGSTISWATDGSVRPSLHSPHRTHQCLTIASVLTSQGTNIGFLICRAADISSPKFVVTQSSPFSTTCFTTPSGNCITDGAYIAFQPVCACRALFMFCRLLD